MRFSRHSIHRVAAATCVVLVTSALLTACSSGRADPRETADKLAAALTTGDVSNVPIAPAGEQAPQADLERIVKSMDDTPVKVTVEKVEDDGDNASATLRTQWAFSGGTWEYSTSAKLSFADDAWQVAWAPDIVAPELTADDRLRVRTEQAARADILGAGDEPLVTARSVQQVGIDKSRAGGDAKDSATRLAQLLGIDASAFRKRVASAGPQAFVVALTVRAGSPDEVTDAQLADIPGSVQLPAELSLAPTREFGQPMLGVVGEATAEIVQKSKGTIAAGDRVGLSGLALRYDEQLRGSPGITVEVVSAKDDMKPREVFSADPQQGDPLRTTIDADLQAAADDILGDVKPASAIVAIQPSSGKILALASGAGGEGADTAASGRYPPGSTFKLVSALALLRSGLKPTTPVPCTSSITVDGRKFTNYSDYPGRAVGDIPLRTAIANSCNTAMIASREKASQTELAAAAAALGLGPDLDLGYPAFLGSVPTESSGTDRAASMIGQGRVEASPLAMAVVAASIVDGSRVTPTLLSDSPTKAAPAADTPVTKTEAKQLQELFRAVVTDGSGAFLSDVPGGAVSAKTGTAEYGNDAPPRTHAWMIAGQGDLAVAVFVADGESGSQTAGPLLERFLRAAS